MRGQTNLGRIAAVMLAAGLVTPGALAQQPGLVDDARLHAAGDADDSNWITFGQDYNNQRFSNLTQINRDNVNDLTVAWLYQTGEVGFNQTNPIVIDGVMYFTSTNADVIAADAATGEPIWRYRHRFTGEIPRASRNRGVAVGYGKVYVGTADRRVIALDQATGEVLWDHEVKGMDVTGMGLGQPDKPLPGPIPFVLLAAPLVLDGMVILGATGFEQNDIGDTNLNAGGDVALDWIHNNLGRRAFLFSLDAETGDEVWRWYTTKQNGWEGNYATTAPDGTPLNRDIKMEQSLSERYADSWASAAVATWMTPSYDPALDLIFMTTGNPAPGNIDYARPGDNLYANSIVAINPHNGELFWYLQHVPHDQWSSDSISQTMLFDLEIDGQMRPVVANGSKTGWIYVQDRATGEFLFQSEAVVPQYNMFVPATPEGTLYMGGGGGIGVSPTSYDPNTGYVYASAIHAPQMRYSHVIPGENGNPDVIWFRNQATGESWGTVTALDMRNGGRIVWQVKTDQPRVGGNLATAGGLLFDGEANGHFNAYDSATGEKLWTFQTGAGMGAPPMSYMVNGRQYVAVLNGAAMPASGVAINPQALRPGGGTMFAFALPEEN